MDDEELRTVVQGLDPMAPAVPITAPDHPAAVALMEEIMNIAPAPANHAHTTPPIGRRRRLRYGLALTAAAAVAFLAVIAVNRDDRETTTSMTLALPDSNSMASCMPFDVAILADMPIAVRGNVIEVTDTEVVISVVTWYASDGDRPDQIRLTQAAGNTSAALDGTTFSQGGDYFITATNGAVNGCGFSGPASPELETAFDTAFNA